MAENSIDIKKNTSILLSRNTPVALVVGSASFFGSHLVDKLLTKNIQVIASDDLLNDSRENLSKASENKNFHLVIASPREMDLALERLDYIFIVPRADENYKKILSLFKDLKPRLLLISSIKLYDHQIEDENLKKLILVEQEIAKVAKEHNLNARILRLGPLFGPRMSFVGKLNDDPISSLIQQSLTEDLQKEIYLDFSSRALYIDDACELAIKCILSGATAQKIFDGVLPQPVKVSEVKQILLDPIWHENKNFMPTQLPPWPTPNLEKTIQFLNWSPKSNLVESLKQTLNYFKENEIKVPSLEMVGESEDLKVEGRNKAEKEWHEQKAGELKGFKQEDKREEKKDKQGRKLPKIPSPIRISSFVITFVFVAYALIWPIFQIGWGILTFRFQLLQAVTFLEKGEFEKSLSSLNQAKRGVEQAQSIFYSLEPIKQTGVLKSQFEIGDSLAHLAILSVEGAENTILGVKNLIISLKSITGELNDQPQDYFSYANAYLASADEDLAKTEAIIGSEEFKSNLPSMLKGRVDSLSERLKLYSDLVKKGRSLSVLLPEIVANDGKKDYLILLQNNHELRPTGGFIGSLAKVSFEGGKLKKIAVNDTYTFDGQLKIHVEPPKEIKNDLDQSNFFLRDSNWEPDFPTSARQAQWFYTKETGERVEGVVALDISAIEDLLTVVGSLDLPDYDEEITADNLFEKAISHAEVNFFPGTQAKKSFLTALTSALFNKLFFLPNQNWPSIVSSLGRSLEGKHMSIYLDDPTLFSYVISQNWASILPRPLKDEKGVVDFLAPVEANLGANKANYYIDRKYNLETTIGKDGEIYHKLRVSYTNRSPSNAFPAGKYKNRMRVYLPSGAKLNKLLWGEADLSKNTESFSDYGRTGYSFLIELLPKEQKTLVLDYQLPSKLEYEQSLALYRLDLIKQAGTLKDPFEWRITYPLNVRLNTDQSKSISPQEHIIQTDLSKNRTFKLEFTKP